MLDIGRTMGLKLYGTASARKHDAVRERGCTPIDYRTEDFVERLAELEPLGVRAALDPIGGSHLHRSYATLAERGMLVAFGVSGDVGAGTWGVVTGMASLARLFFRPDGKKVRFYGIGTTPTTSHRRSVDDWRAILGLAAEGRITPLIGAQLPFAEVREAHDLMDRGAVTGKIVLVA